MIETQIEAFCLHNTTTFPSLNLLTFPNLSGFHQALPLPVLSCFPVALQANSMEAAATFPHEERKREV